MNGIDIQNSYVETNPVETKRNSNSCNRKQQWLAEWESVFLQSQSQSKSESIQKDAGSNANVSGGRPYHRGKEEVSGKELTRDKSTKMLVQESGHTVLPELVVKTQAIETGTKVSGLQQAGHTGRAHSTLNSEVRTSNPPLKASSNLIPDHRSENTQLSTFRVSKNGEEVRVWLRDSMNIGNSGQKLLQEMRQALSGLGLKLVSMTINGEKVYSESRSYSDTDIASGNDVMEAENKLNKII